MNYTNILNFKDRASFREWLAKNYATEKECWIPVKRGKIPPEDCIWYLDAVEEALCFGWIDSVLKTIDDKAYQRFGPRKKNSRWTELNKERCKRLEKLGLMTEAGKKVYPDNFNSFEIDHDIIAAFEQNITAWNNFQAFHQLYQRVRIDNIQRVRGSELFENRLYKLIEASEKNKMIGDWHDYKRLLDY